MLGLLHVVPTAGHALAWGVSASGVLQLALLVWAVRRAGMRLHLPRPRLTPEMRGLLRRMAPGLLGAGITQLNLSVDVIIGSLLPAGHGVGAVLCRPDQPVAAGHDRRGGRHGAAADAVAPGASRPTRGVALAT